MKIVHVVNSLTIGGREKVVIELCNELVKTNIVTIITLFNDNNQLKDKVDKKINIVQLPFSSGISGTIKLWIFGFSMLRSLLLDINPNVIHNHVYFHYFLFVALVSKSKKIHSKAFRTIHTSGLFYQVGGFLNKIRLNVEKIATKINKPNLVSISKSIFNNNELYFTGLYENNKYIPNGINFIKLEEESKPVVNLSSDLLEEHLIGVYVARLDDGKNHKMVVNAISELYKLNFDIKMLFVGDGKLREDLEEMVKSLQLQRNIIFIGFTDQVASYLKIADFAVFPSDFEGFPLSLIEKMYYKLPVIVSNIDVFSEVITDHVNGYIFDLKQPDELRDKILYIYNNRKLSQTIGEEGRATALMFDIKNISNETINYYNSKL